MYYSAVDLGHSAAGRQRGIPKKPLPFLCVVLFLRSVGMLSNLGRIWSHMAPEDSLPLEIRTARPEELREALRLILRSAPFHGEDQQLRELAGLAASQRGNLAGAWMALQRGQPLSTALPIVSPGRTMLLFVPQQLRGPLHAYATGQLVERLCAAAAVDGVHLVQVLLDAHGEDVRQLLASCGFVDLAELLYLHTNPGRPIRDPELPPRCEWIAYSEQEHHLFARAIVATYQQSLDCPRLNGLREVEDIIAGHKATGEFDPSRWLLLRQTGRTLGVLLLAVVPQTDAMELVYLGLDPEFRGRGIGDILMRRALYETSVARRSRLSLAVDANNTPALKLYWRHGMQALGRKLAMMRNLRSVQVQLGPAAQAPLAADSSDSLPQLR